MATKRATGFRSHTPTTLKHAFTHAVKHITDHPKVGKLHARFPDGMAQTLEREATLPSSISLTAAGEQTITLESRFVYGRGTIETPATVDESGVLRICERASDDIPIIPIMTCERQDRLHHLIIGPHELPLSSPKRLETE